MTDSGFHRFRRLRDNAALRRLVRETRLHAGDFVYPIFVMPGSGRREEIAAMPGQFRVTVDRVAAHVEPAAKAGVGAILIFGTPEHKSETGNTAADDHSAVCEAVRTLKKEFPDLAVITDVCLCSYTTHGHCGIVEDGRVANDPTLKVLSEVAVAHANSGVDMVAPSDMMDGRVAAIRAALDAAGHDRIPIMSYSSKFASSFYGPFREAADSTPQFGDRRGYQMDPANAREAIRESLEDEDEGADILMVKPALPYLDILARLRDATLLPLAAYHVSGEYAMIKAAAGKGWIDEERVMEESLLAIKRAGADIIITYYAPRMAERLRK